MAVLTELHTRVILGQSAKQDHRPHLLASFAVHVGSKSYAGKRLVLHAAALPVVAWREIWWSAVAESVLCYSSLHFSRKVLQARYGHRQHGQGSN